MPKVMLTDQLRLDQNCADLARRIRAAAAYLGITQRELARKSGMETRTLYGRLQNPSTFRVFELQAISRVLHLKIGDIIDTKGAITYEL